MIKCDLPHDGDSCERCGWSNYHGSRDDLIMGSAGEFRDLCVAIAQEALSAHVLAGSPGRLLAARRLARLSVQLTQMAIEANRGHLLAGEEPISVDDA